jgi:hypothetical protein
MLITFEGKGCKNCPFCYYDETLGHDLCSLSRQETAEGIELERLLPSTVEKDSIFGKINETFGKKPDGCPFKGFPGNIEISAMEPE